MERQRPERPAPVWPVTTVVLVGLIALLLVTGGDGPVTVVLPTLVAVAAAGVAAWAVRRSRRARADYDARLTEWAASEAVLSERVRIASDLHDIVSHALGLITVSTRRNAVAILMGVELMLNAGALNFVAFAQHVEGGLSGHVVALFVVVMAAAEAAIALAIVLALWRAFRTVDATQTATLKD